MPILVVFAVAFLAGGVTALVVRRFPALDPAAPRVAPAAIVEVAKRPGLSGFLRARTDPEALTGLLLSAALLIALAGVIAVGALFAMVEHNALLARYDLGAAHWGATNATTLSTRVLRDISLLGGTLAMILIALGVAIVEYGRTRSRAVVWFLIAVVAGQTVLVNLTKYIVGRPRPDIAQLTGFSGSSFPSGHAATAAATFAAIAFLIGRGRSHRTKVIAASFAVAIATAVATTRVLLGVHWLTDVLAGVALGWGWFALCSVAFGGRVLRFGQPVVVAEAAAELTPH